MQEVANSSLSVRLESPHDSEHRQHCWHSLLAQMGYGAVLGCGVTWGLLGVASSAAANPQQSGGGAAAPASIGGAEKSTAQPAPVQDGELGDTDNVHTCGSLYLAGQPTEEDIARLKAAGIERVISLRTDGEVDWDQAAKLRETNIEFVQIPFRSPETLTDDVFAQVRKLLRETEQTPTLLHCGSANRVGAVWLTHRVLDEGVPVEQALAEAKKVGLRAPDLERKALDYIQRQQAAASQKVGAEPSINAQFTDPNLNVDEWVKRFEVESREIFASREAVIAACGVQPGWEVADIGAGTGLYTQIFAQAVGPQGWIYAVDISPKFLEHINRQTAQAKVQHVTSVLGDQASVHLPTASIDLAFICDTYHHFEAPHATLASIREALRPDGTLVVIDFERIPGKSRDWVLTHVRAGRAEVIDEIQAAGFELVASPQIPGFEENYFLKFRKK